MKSALVIIPLLLPLHAHAGGSDKPAGTVSAPSAPTTSAATASAVSRSASHATARVQNNVTITNAARSSDHSDAGNSPAGGLRGGQGLRVPDVAPPSISGGNPCSVGVSLGGSGMGGGGAFGLMWESHDCALRQQAALMANLGRPDVAVGLLCNDPWVRDAMARQATPCAIDRERWIKEGWRP